MKRVVPYLLVAAAITGLVAGFLAYRTEVTAAKAAQYAPAAVQRRVIPAGTQIQAVLRGIAESTRPGDNIIGFVSVPVVVNGEATIPAGTVLKGVIKEIASRREQAATVRVDFRHLVYDDRELDIATEPVMATTSIVSDFDLLSSALETTTGAAVGAAMGASSKGQGMVGIGLVRGALSGVAPPVQQLTPITLVLKESLELSS